MSQPPKRPPAPYLAARIFTAMLTGFIWSCILALVGFAFSGLITRDAMTAGAVKYMMAGTYIFIPFFSAHGVLTGLREGFARGDFLLPGGISVSDAAGKPSAFNATHAINPWSLAMRWALALGAPASIAAMAAAPAIWPGGVSRGWFVLFYVCGGALLAVVTSFFVSGSLFLKEASVPHHRRCWTGSRRAYLLTRHAVPNGLVNALINGIIAFAIFPQPVLDPGNAVPLQTIVGDTLIALLILTVAVMNGARAHARSDIRWGVIDSRPQPNAPSIPGALLRMVGLALLLTVIVFGVLQATDIQSMSLTAFVIYRTVAFGAYPTFVAYTSARWALRSIRIEQ